MQGKMNTIKSGKKGETMYDNERRENEPFTYSWVRPDVKQESAEGAAAQQTQTEGAAENTQSTQNTQSAWTAGAAQNTQNTQSAWTAGAAQNTQNTRNAWQAQAPERANLRRDERPRKKKKRRWPQVVALGLLFGLVAGATMYGVNLLGNRIHPVATAQSAPAVQVASTRPADETAGESGSGTAELASSAATGGEMSVAEVASQMMPAMVTISTMSVQEMQSFFGGSQRYEVPGAGTGFIISQTESELLIATNNHVVADATQVSVGFVDETAASASIKGLDPDTDIAVIAVKMADISEETAGKIRVATLGNSDELVLGEQVVAIGNALGYGQSVTSGYVSGFDRELALSDGVNTFTAPGLIQTDAAINSGNSGGALVNMRGEVIGINEAKSSRTSSGTTVDNVGYVIPMAKAMPILQDLMNQETKDILPEDKQGYLSVTCADVTDEYAQMYDMPKGVCFTGVFEESPVAAAGGKKGDVLVKFDGQSISNFSALTNKMKYYAEGETVELVVMRANEGEYKEVVLTVTLGPQSLIQQINEQLQDPQGQGPQEQGSSEDEG